MASEWEALMELSKEELVIELVRARRSMRNLRSILAEMAEDGGAHFLYDRGEVPPADWLQAIAAHAAAGLEPGEELSESDLERYGVDGDAAEAYIESLEREGERWRGASAPRRWWCTGTTSPSP